jgi:murein L,D-transpeptidase YafK
MLAVDKSSQRLYLVAGDVPLRIAVSYACTTGQVPGDKWAQGDLKTPEGIYFIVNRLSSGLDYTLYGNEAYTLNYPNPVDKLRRKTGYGIWLHGRGERISPLQTQGCIALNNEDLAGLGEFLQPGTPVTLTETYHQRETAPPQDTSTVNTLKQQVVDWAGAWSSRSPKLFDFYDEDAYSIAQEEPFALFRKQKERLFRTLPWIKTTVRDTQVLPGPGYWVTWFFQDYSAPNLSTQGVRRLYWQQNEAGQFKIVGMEWIPGTTTSLLMAEKSFPAGKGQIDGRWEGGGQPISEEQAVPLPEALAAAERGRTIAANAVAAAEVDNTLTPEERVIMPGPDAEPTASAAQIPPEAGAAPRLPAQTTANTEDGNPPPLDHVEDPRLGKMAEPPQAAALRAEFTAANPGYPQEQAAPDPSEPSPADSSPPDPGLPPALPAQRLAAYTPSDSAAPQAAASPPALSSPALSVRRMPHAKNQAAPSPPPEIPGGSQKKKEEKAADPPADPGQKTAEPSAAALEGPSAQAVEALIRERVENWRKAWQHGDLDQYCRFYAPLAIQDKRTSAEAIRRHKQTLWSRAAPAKVDLTDIRIVCDGNTATVVMRQQYADSRSRGDSGIKTLVWKQTGHGWLIIEERWNPEP